MEDATDYVHSPVEHHRWWFVQLLTGFVTSNASTSGSPARQARQVPSILICDHYSAAAHLDFFGTNLKSTRSTSSHALITVGWSLPCFGSPSSKIPPDPPSLPDESTI
eukprot:5185024-Amphidinium_carterae.1